MQNNPNSNSILNIAHFITQRLKEKYSQSQINIVSWQLLEWLTGQAKIKLLASDYKINSREQELLEKALNDILENDKPLEYITGVTNFLDLKLEIKEPILIPRPETEFWTNNLIEQIKKSFNQNLVNNNSIKILDLCTGSGCIGLALAQAIETSEVTAIDINPEACALAEKNAQRNNIRNFKVKRSDLFESLNKQDKFSIIVSNPPYIKHSDWLNLDKSVKDWEDKAALTTEQDGLKIIEKIIKSAPAWFCQNSNFNSELWLEFDPWQKNLIIKLLEDAKFYSITIHQDQYGKERIVSALWNPKH